MSVDPVFDELSQEFAISVDGGGTIAWADARAERRGLRAGRPLAELVVAGCEEKAVELLRRGAAGRLVGWELPLVLDERPITVVFAAAPSPHGVALLGSVAAHRYAEDVAAGNRAIHELVDLNRELARKKLQLEESNRGIRALHAELAQQADQLRTASEVKSRLVASVSHELRSPLHSILVLSDLLLTEVDGPLAAEQRTQLQLMRRSTGDLARMIDDMLDLSRLEAGAAPIRVEQFELADVLSALRGTMTPLIPAGRPIELVFDPVPDIPLETDQAKLGQILRNLVSNALKFTESGVVRVRARVDGERLSIDVEDTGIGIAPADHARVFEEFTQIDSQLQRAARGTGLGLPLSRKLAEALGGKLELASALGVGSKLTLTLPLEHPEVAAFRRLEIAAQTPDPAKVPVLVVEDERSTIAGYDRALAGAGFQIIPARTTRQARQVLRRVRPAVILLDVMLDGEDTWSLLGELKHSPGLSDIPVFVCTVTNRESRARALGADEFWFKPLDHGRLVEKLRHIAGPRPPVAAAADGAGLQRRSPPD